MDALRMKTPPWDIQGIECAVWAAEGKTVTLMDQNVYFHSEAPGLLDDENETYLMTILLCHPASSRRLSFRNFACAVAY